MDKNKVKSFWEGIEARGTEALRGTSITTNSGKPQISPIPRMGWRGHMPGEF